MIPRVLIFAALLLIVTCVRARADEPHINCEFVRHYVAAHGRAKALAWAIEQGYSWRSIQAARRCLR